jgi:hypothetical protein
MKQEYTKVSNHLVNKASEKVYQHLRNQLHNEVSEQVRNKVNDYINDSPLNFLFIQVRREVRRQTIQYETNISPSI